MSYCVVPGCLQPRNPETHRVCQSCGSKLWLKERYRALYPLGQGGFGRTFLAIDQDIPSQPRCVIKQLFLPNASAESYHKAVQLFHQEAVRLEELGNHPQIPSLLAHFEQNRLLYLVQEFVDGQTLAEEVASRGPFSESQVRKLLQDLLPVLTFIHDRQVIHRDIKPANIMRRRQDQKLVLIDFGIAKQVTGSTSSQTGTIVGSPEYMAPEQTRGKVVPASDLYSLGVVCIRLLTNRSPFELFDVGNNCWYWRDRLPSGNPISSHLSNLLDKLLQGAVNQRYQSANDVAQALQRSTQIESPPSRTHQPQPLPAQPSQPRAPEETYQKLRSFLAAKKWQQADAATWDIIRHLLNKPINGYVFSGELNHLPCADLERLDQLWVRYSWRRFGFSVQARIYQAVGEDYWVFCDRVGWQHTNSADHSDHWRFESSAPAGHLPSRLVMGGQQWWRHVAVMTARLEQCGS